MASLDKAHVNINGLPIHILDAGTQRHDMLANSNADNSNTQTRAVNRLQIMNELFADMQVN